MKGEKQTMEDESKEEKKKGIKRRYIRNKEKEQENIRVL